jgi:hypothetical protein
MSGYPLSPADRDPQQHVNAIRATYQGQVDFTGDVTLATGAATTVVKAPTAGVGQRVFLYPQTAAAAAEAATTWAPKVSTPAQFTVHHANNATAGRTFSWEVLG